MKDFNFIFKNYMIPLKNMIKLNYKKKILKKKTKIKKKKKKK